MENIFPPQHFQEQKQAGKNYIKPFVLWFTGLSGSGKSAIAHKIEIELKKREICCVNVDGDMLRSGLCNNLGFSDEDRKENLRRAAELCKIFLNNGICVVAAFISPKKEQRKMIEEIVGENKLHLAFVDVDLKECMKRDPKNLYKKAVAGEISNFTGLEMAYEKPENHSIYLENSEGKLDECVKKVVIYLESKGLIKTDGLS